jgi:hypothetical protein
MARFAYGSPRVSFLPSPHAPQGQALVRFRNRTQSGRKRRAMAD